MRMMFINDWSVFELFPQQPMLTHKIGPSHYQNYAIFSSYFYKTSDFFNTGRWVEHYILCKII